MTQQKLKSTLKYHYMNSSELIERLKKHVKDFQISLNTDIVDVDWKIEEDHPQKIIFIKATEKVKEILDTRELSCLVVSTEDLKQKNQIIILEEDWNETQKIVCDHFYPELTKIKKIGITGTNGKTSTVYFLMQMFNLSGYKSFSIGTLGLLDGATKKTVKDFNLTTPSYIDIRKILSGYFGKFDFVCFEVSSHALEQERFYKIKFDVAGWTSFTQDHLDYHKTMEDYHAAKMKIFDLLDSKQKLFVSSSELPLIKSIMGKNKNAISASAKFDVTNTIFEISYNKANVDIAYEIFHYLLPDEKIDFKNIESPPGRLEILKNGKQSIIIDYAHTPDAILNITKAIKEKENNKVLTIFGCGGDRDASKRPLMAKAAERYSDYIILTSDNPRFEEPAAIIADASAGFEKNNFKIIVDRKEAIKEALTDYQDYTIIIVGKGHENYLDIKGIKYPYSDKEEVERYIHAKS